VICWASDTGVSYSKFRLRSCGVRGPQPASSMLSVAEVASQSAAAAAMSE
jgi:hypothetical protein